MKPNKKQIWTNYCLTGIIVGGEKIVGDTKPLFNDLLSNNHLLINTVNTAHPLPQHPQQPGDGCVYSASKEAKMPRTFTLMALLPCLGGADLAIMDAWPLNLYNTIIWLENILMVGKHLNGWKTLKCWKSRKYSHPFHKNWLIFFLVGFQESLRGLLILKALEADLYKNFVSSKRMGWWWRPIS